MSVSCQPEDTTKNPRPHLLAAVCKGVHPSFLILGLGSASWSSNQRTNSWFLSFTARCRAVVPGWRRILTTQSIFFAKHSFQETHPLSSPIAGTPGHAGPASSPAPARSCSCSWLWSRGTRGCSPRHLCHSPGKKGNLCLQIKNVFTCSPQAHIAQTPPGVQVV